MFNLLSRWKNRNRKAFRIFSSEQETIASLPLDQAVQVLAGDKSICIIRTSEGISALEDRCPHQDAPIHRGKCRAKGTITCSYHGMQIDLKSGHLIEERIGVPSQVYPVEFSKSGLVIWI
jgi:nitrite reductase/ring-hydroxylating ferredoxin subunit